jgi:hypothetical protein
LEFTDTDGIRNRPDFKEWLRENDFSDADVRKHLKDNGFEDSDAYFDKYEGSGFKELADWLSVLEA